jgi:hypothetical protein
MNGERKISPRAPDPKRYGLGVSQKCSGDPVSSIVERAKMTYGGANSCATVNARTTFQARTISTALRKAIWQDHKTYQVPFHKPH